MPTYIDKNIRFYEASSKDARIYDSYAKQQHYRDLMNFMNKHKVTVK